jgi:hypothetical protein
MKIRLGFVSNSSSASFALEIGKSKKEIYDILVAELPQYFKKENFKKILIEEIKKEEERKLEILKHQQENKEAKEKGIALPHFGLYGIWLSQLENTLNSNLNFLKNFDKLDNNKLFDKILRFYEYNININILGKLEISGFTFMWNEDKDMGEVLFAIKTLLDIKYKNKIKYSFEFRG